MVNKALLSMRDGYYSTHSYAQLLYFRKQLKFEGQTKVTAYTQSSAYNRPNKISWTWDPERPNGGNHWLTLNHRDKYIFADRLTKATFELNSNFVNYYQKYRLYSK